VRHAPIQLSLLLLILLSACQPAVAPDVQPGMAAPPSSVTLLPAAPTSTPQPTLTASPTPTATIIPPTPTPSDTPASTFTPTEPPIITLLFTGVIVPARCVQAALDEIGNPDHPYEEVRPIIQVADIAIGTFNATMSNRVERTGCLVTTYQLVGSPDNADAAARAGFDVMSVATNHIKDCGLNKSWCNEAFFDTLANLHRVGILTVGAGKDLAEALQPVVVTVNGVRFGFVSLGDSKQDESVFATDDWPGIAYLNEENLRTAVAQVKQIADVVIVMPHWGSEDIILPNGIQRNQANLIVSLGVDLVVGNHTHVIQAYHELNGTPVFYGLGNFIFDQGLRDHRQGVILLVRFQGTQYLGYELIPTYHERDGRVHLADKDEAAEIMQRLQEANQQLP
jgi:poly-gamma-glutamate synthesis protein (capsule biosynthesis protein)